MVELRSMDGGLNIAANYPLNAIKTQTTIID